MSKLTTEYRTNLNSITRYYVTSFEAAVEYCTTGGLEVSEHIDILSVLDFLNTKFMNLSNKILQYIPIFSVTMGGIIGKDGYLVVVVAPPPSTPLPLPLPLQLLLLRLRDFFRFNFL